MQRIRSGLPALIQDGGARAVPGKRLTASRGLPTNCACNDR